MRAQALLLALTVVPGCSFGLGFDGTQYQCGAGERCPDGQACVAGVCTASTDAPPLTDGGDPDAPAPAAVCGNLSLLRDTFDGPATGGPWYPFDDPGSAVAEAGGELVVDLPAGVDAYAGYISAYLYDLHGGALVVQVDEVTTSATILEVRNYQDATAQLLHEDGQIQAVLLNQPGAGVIRARPWNPAEKYWRIREDAGDMVWELSTDRAIWTELERRALPFPVEHVQGAVSGGGVAPTPSRARFEDVNLDASAATMCSADELRDDFAAAPFAPNWGSYTDPGCTMTENGDLVMTFQAATGNTFCGITSNHQWNLQDGAFVVDGTSFPSQASFVSYVQAAQPGNGRTRIEFTVDGNDFDARTFVDDVSQGARNALVDRIAHRFWRLRAEGDTAIFDTSPDGTTWNEFYRQAVPWDLSAVEVHLGAGAYGASPAVTIRVPGVNAP